MEIQHDGIQHETDNAISFIFDRHHIWIPKSIIDDYDDLVVEIPEWFVEEYELDGYAI